MGGWVGGRQGVRGCERCREFSLLSHAARTHRRISLLRGPIRAARRTGKPKELLRGARTASEALRFARTTEPSAALPLCAHSICAHSICRALCAHWRGARCAHSIGARKPSAARSALGRAQKAEGALLRAARTATATGRRAGRHDRQGGSRRHSQQPAEPSPPPTPRPSSPRDCPFFRKAFDLFWAFPGKCQETRKSALVPCDRSGHRICEGRRA